MSATYAARTMPASATARLLGLGAVVCIAGSVLYMSLNGIEPREAYAHPVNLTGAALTTVGSLLLALGLVEWRADLPRWTTLVAGAGVLTIGATAWAQAATLYAAAEGTTNAQFEDLFFGDLWVGLGMGVKVLLCTPAFIAIAVTGWRRGAVSRLAAIGFGVAGLLSLFPPHPPGLIVASLALLVVARAEARS